MSLYLTAHWKELKEVVLYNTNRFVGTPYVRTGDRIGGDKKKINK